MLLTKEVYTLDEAADILIVSKRNIYRLIESGKIKTFRVGKMIRISKQEMERIING